MDQALSDGLASSKVICWNYCTREYTQGEGAWEGGYLAHWECISCSTEICTQIALSRILCRHFLGGTMVDEIVRYYKILTVGIFNDVAQR